MSSIRIKYFVIIISASLVPILLFLIFDFCFGRQFSNSNKILTVNEKPYLNLDYGWYELKKNFKGQDQFGPLIYLVETDEHGFRKDPNIPAHQKYNIIFLGDSFTYGINGSWDKTFVGMFGSKTEAKVLNAGVSSYSPTPYLYQYKKALKEGILSDRHTVIVAIDMSDVQDEASYWEWDEANQVHPRRFEYILKNHSTQKRNDDLHTKIRDSLPLSVKIYRYVQYIFSYLRYNIADRNDVPLSISNHPRSAFTWEEWSLLNATYPYQDLSGYAPLGVNKGLEKVGKQVSKIVKLASKNNSKVYFLIYPWPAQIVYSDKFNWSSWIRGLCEKENCSGVVDTIPTFRALAKKNKKWFRDYYVLGDIHFNERGNQIISEEIIKSINMEK